MAPRPRSARQLAERYEVSTRTIERDILALQESGVPIYAETGRRGGYAIDKTLTLPPLNFTAAEMVAIAVSLAREETTPFAAATRSALRKVLATASAAQAAEAGELLDRVRLIGPARPGERRAAGARAQEKGRAAGKLAARDWPPVGPGRRGRRRDPAAGICPPGSGRPGGGAHRPRPRSRSRSRKPSPPGMCSGLPTGIGTTARRSGTSSQWRSRPPGPSGT